MSEAVSKEDWARLRQDARQTPPVCLMGEDLPEVLLTYQQGLLTTTAVHQVTVVEKSRRTGYTWGVGADAVLTSAAARSAGGMDSLYIGYNLDMAREFIDVCGMWAKAFSQAASEVEEFLFRDRHVEGDRDIQAFRISFASGYEILALSSKPRSLRGRQGYVIIDEAAFHDDLNELLKAAMALLIWGGKVLVISTHDGDTNPFAVLVEDIRKGRKPYALITLDFDQALRDGLYQRICLVTGALWSTAAEAEWRDKIIAFYGEDADEELYVIPSTGSGTYLPGPLLEQRQERGIPVVRLERGNDFLLLSDDRRTLELKIWCEDELVPLMSRFEPDLDSMFGHDFARNGDLSVFWPVQMQHDRVLRPPFVLEMRNIPYAQQRQILWFILDRMPRFQSGAMDATGNGMALAEETATRYGLDRVAQIKITAGWYGEHMPLFKAAFEDGGIMIPADDPIFNDHRAIKLVRGVPTILRESKKTGKGEEAGKGQRQLRHGDSAVADLLAFVASRMDPAEYDYTAIGGRDEGDDWRDGDGRDGNHRDGAGWVGAVSFGKGAW